MLGQDGKKPHEIAIIMSASLHLFINFFGPVMTIKSAGTCPRLSLYKIKYVEIYIVAFFSALYLKHI